MDNTTDLYTAADAILAPAPESEGAGEDNLRDAVDAITEPTDDDQSDEIEEAAEGADDIEASDEGDEDFEELAADAEIDDDQVVDDAEDTNLIPVKVDGKDEMWTLDQLKQSAAGQSAINKRFQEAAEARKQIEAQAAALQQQQQKVLELYQQAQSGALTPPTPPSDEMFSEDPIGYMEEKIKFDKAQAAYQQQVAQLQDIQRQQAQQNMLADEAYRNEQAKLLAQHIPELVDPKRSEALKSDLIGVGSRYGFSQEEMMGVSDHRYIRALNDALKYHKIVAKRKEASAKGEKARPVVKAGAKKTPDGNAATRKKAQQRLQKTGSIEDAVSLIFKS